MVKKFSVGIPDEMAERLEPFKDSISPTAVFRQAMDEAITKRENFKERMDKLEGTQKEGAEQMQEIIERLKKQKAEFENTLFDEGEEYGLDFAKSADYEDLKYAAMVIADDCEPVSKALERDGQLEDYFEGLEDEEGNELIKNMDETDLEKWIQGWCHAVREFWNKVSSQL